MVIQLVGSFIYFDFYMYLFLYRRHLCDFLYFLFKYNTDSQEVAKNGTYSPLEHTPAFSSGDNLPNCSLISNLDIDIGTGLLIRLQIVFRFHHFFMLS